MTFGKGFRFAHSEALAFIIACPLVALIPLLAELAQHTVEMHIGMYDSWEGAVAADGNPLRTQFGLIKTLALSIIGYPVIRYLAGGRDRSAALRFDPRAVALFFVPLAFGIAIAALTLFVASRDATTSLAAFAGSLLLMPLLLRWTVAAPLGMWVSPIRSIREMLPAWLWAIAFSLATMLPLMTVHYALGAAAIVSAQWAKWPLLVTDCLVVTWLAVMLSGSQWIAAIRPGPLDTPRAAQQHSRSVAVD